MRILLLICLISVGCCSNNASPSPRFEIGQRVLVVSKYDSTNPSYDGTIVCFSDNGEFVNINKYYQHNEWESVKNLRRLRDNKISEALERK